MEPLQSALGIIALLIEFLICQLDTGVSFIISLGFLSSRRPLNDGWRKRPSGVHSRNSTSATVTGSTKITFRSRTLDEKGLLSRVILSNRSLSSIRSCHRNLSQLYRQKLIGHHRLDIPPIMHRRHASTSSFSGIQPPITNSCLLTPFILSQALERVPGRYGLSLILATMPSN